MRIVEITKNALNWIASNFAAIERTVLTLAALFALWPLFEWWSERDARRLDRASNLVEANLACLESRQNGMFQFDELALQDTLLKYGFGTAPEKEVIAPSRALSGPRLEMELEDARWKLNIFFMCSEIRNAAVHDTSASNESAEIIEMERNARALEQLSLRGGVDALKPSVEGTQTPEPSSE